MIKLEIIDQLITNSIVYVAFSDTNYAGLATVMYFDQNSPGRYVLNHTAFSDSSISDINMTARGSISPQTKLAVAVTNNSAMATRIYSSDTAWAEIT